MSTPLQTWINSLLEKDPRLGDELIGRIAEIRGSVRTHEPLSEDELQRVLLSAREYIEGNPELDSFVRERFGQDWAQ